MIPLLKHFFVVAPALFFFLQAGAQFPEYRYFNLEKENKQVKINTLFKNNRGYLLAGTDNGLYKFDGRKYTRIDFKNEEFNDTVTAIFQDRNEKMWIGFRSGRIANVINNKLQYFNPEEGTPKKKITAFLQDKEGRLWFAAQGEGVYCLQNNRLYLINLDDGLSDNNVSQLILAGNDDVLAGTDQGINICTFKNGIKKITTIGPRQGLPDYIVTSITRAGKNIFWIGLQDKGFCLYDHDTKKIIVPDVGKVWSSGQINSILQAQNMLWIATQNNGFFKYSMSGGTLTRLPESIAGNTINDLLEDNQGNLWLSAPGYGLVRFPGEAIKLLRIPSAPPFEHVHVILSDKNGNIWLNNKENDLIKLMVTNGIAVEKKLHINVLNEKTDITSLYEDINGNIWVGTMGKGLFIVDPKSFTYRAFTENSLFLNAGVLSITGNQNSVFCSSLAGAMVVNIFPDNRDIFKKYQFTDYNNKNTSTNYIYSIFKDNRNRIWFATDGKGLAMMQDNKFSYFNDQLQIKDKRIYSITEDRKGNIWFSTSSAGIYKFDGKTFTNFGIDEGLSDLNISVLKTDGSGNIIVVHKKGLDILNPETGNISYITASQGLSEINVQDIGAVTKDTSGNIMVSTVNGILTYSSQPNTLQKPITIIESVQLFLNDLDDNTSRVFAHDENNFTFNYTGLYYTDPEKVYYKYKLEGFDSNWIVTNDRSKNFPKLEPGKYTFRIQSALNKNFKNADEAAYSFIIKQAFYKTWWFILLCTLSAILLLYLYIKTREKELKKIEKLRQEKIQFQFEVLRNQINPHFLFNSFNTLISVIEEEPQIAVEYAEHLSTFFRNIVSQRDKDLITLRDEISSLYSYSFIQKKRYGDYLIVDINVSEEQKMAYKIPPLSLQLLVENAIKHNAVSKETPLLISIFITEENNLCISNNKNTKTMQQEGAGMGLQNIITRYNLLSNKPVKVIQDEQNFIVLLPLLN